MDGRFKAAMCVTSLAVVMVVIYFLVGAPSGGNGSSGEREESLSSGRSRKIDGRNSLESPDLRNQEARKQFTDTRGKKRDIRDTIDGILMGNSVLNSLPGKSDLSAALFYRELNRALREDLLVSLDYSNIERVLGELTSQTPDVADVPQGFLDFLADLKTELGPARDFSEKMRMVNQLEPKMSKGQLKSFLNLLGSKKAPGHLDSKSVENFGDQEMKALLSGMSRSGDLSAIDLALNHKGETNAELLGYTARALMRTYPGKSISYFDEIKDPKMRKKCLLIAVESLRVAGATEEAEEWAKVIGE